jgi:hypothetical protein
MITISGKDAKVDAVQDWYRRNEEGMPLPAEWRDLLGQIHAPWASKNSPAT